MGNKSSSAATKDFFVGNTVPFSPIAAIYKAAGGDQETASKLSLSDQIPESEKTKAYNTVSPWRTMEPGVAKAVAQSKTIVNDKILPVLNDIPAILNDNVVPVLESLNPIAPTQTGTMDNPLLGYIVIACGAYLVYYLIK